MAPTRHDSAFQGISVSERPTLLILSTGVLFGACVLLLPVTGWAQDLPTGGTVAQGSVDIGTPTGSSLLIQQNSDRAVVNWDSFSIGAGGHVGITQPSTSSALLNRVTGAATSQIHGQITANGQVFVVNPNGIFIGRDGSVKAGGGFVASTLDIGNDNFMAGRLRFEGNGNSAAVENAGRVSIGRGGYAALLGGRVSNAGVVTVPLGRIGLGAGERITLDLSGDQFLQVAVPSDSDDADVRALIENAGTVSADGGLIEMRAATARNAARHAVNLSGVAEARSVSVHNGAIVLGGGAGGSVQVTGRVTTRAKQPRPQRARIQVETSRRPQVRPEDPVSGGDITITGADISLTGALIDASGASGGQVRIGGDYQGGGTLPTAQTLSVDAATVIQANAGEDGQGGRIILWSDLYTEFAGLIEARGGTKGGDGGFVEVSGRQMLNFTGLADTRAPQGAAGTLLLDPVNVSIQDVDPTPPGFETPSSEPGNPANDFDPSGLDPSDVDTGCCNATADAVINVADLERNLELGNVIVSTGSTSDGYNGEGNITVDAAVNWNLASTLTLQALNNIVINQPILSNSGGLVLTAPGSVTLSPGGNVTIGSFSATAANLFVNDATFTELLGGGAITVDRFSMNEPAGLAGSWVQNSAGVSTFAATEFELSPQSTFLRAAGGSGTVADPYLLTDVYGLQGISSRSLIDQNFALANDIDATGTSNWNPSAVGPTGFAPIVSTISTAAEPVVFFSGSLDGRGNTIDGLFIDRGQPTPGRQASASLFFAIDGSVISNLNMTNVNVQGSNSVAALVGSAFDSTLDTINVQGRVGDGVGVGVNSATDVGGIVASMSDSQLVDSSFTGSIDVDFPSTIYQHIGGLVGDTFIGTVSGSSFDGTIVANGGTDNSIGATSTRDIGGIVGSNLVDTSNNTSTGSISVSGIGETNVGGLVGYTQGAVADSSSDVDISISMAVSERMFVGGLVGEAFSGGDITGSSFDGSILADGIPAAVAVSGTVRDVGGVVGSSANLVADTTSSGTILVAGEGEARVGGLAGHSTGGISNSSSSVALNVTSLTTDRIHVGGLVGYQTTTGVDNAFATGDISVTSGGAPVVGGLLGYSEGVSLGRLVTDVSASGDVTVTATATTIPLFDPGRVGGLIGENSSEITNAFATGAVTVNTSGAQVDVGGFAGANVVVSSGVRFGTITASSASGTVTLDGEVGDDMSVGGFVGDNQSEVTRSISSSDVSYNQTLTGPGGGASDVYVGGFAGTNASLLSETAARGAVNAVADTAVLSVGGHTGLNLGADIENSYATGSVSVTSAASNAVGGLVGATVADVTNGSITSVYSSGSVGSSGAGLSQTGGLIGANFDLDTSLPETTVTGGFWDLDTSGQPDLMQTGFGTGLTTAQFQDTDGFVALATGQGWSFLDWAPGDAGHYPALYAIDPVLFAQPDPITLVYGETDTATSSGTVFGGPAQYVFGPAGDTIDTTAAFDTPVFSDVTVGTQRISQTFGPVTSTLGQAYRVVNGGAAATITPAPLTITALDQTKTYGETFTFVGDEFDSTPLQFSDSITSVTFRSGGTFMGSSVAGAPYSIEPSNALGFDTGNYDITYVLGSFFVDRAPLVLTPLDQTKFYGDTFAFDGTEFTQTGLVTGPLITDAVTSLTLSSAGAVDTAGVGASPYPITGTSPVGTGLENYTVTIGTGNLSVTPLSRDVIIDDQSKTYGETFAFVGTEFTASLLFGDAVTSMALTSDGAVDTAIVAGSPYAITGTVTDGTGLENYDLTIVPGALTVDRALASVTPNDQTKIYGDTVTFDSAAFTSAGFLFSDGVTSLSMSSDGAVDTAGVAGSPYAIGGSSPVGTGLGNYSLTIGEGALTVAPLPRTVQINDQTKTYGELLAFDGTEFSPVELLFSDAITRLDLTSPGAPARAGVSGSPYAITGTVVEGTGLENYAFSYLPGELTVDPAGLTIALDDQTKTYGEEFPFDGTEFVATGLLFAEDTVDTVEMFSAGAEAMVGVAGSPYEINQVDDTAAVGTGLENYDITVVPGALTVDPADLTITLNDRTKTYGEELPIDGTEFTPTGLLFTDAVTSVGITSPGAAAAAEVAGSPYDITNDEAVAAVGTGLENYDISFVSGALTVDRAPLTVTLNDQTKAYGTLFTFDGTQFVPSGLLLSDTLTNVSMTSDGAVVSAGVAGSPYPITAVDDVALTGTGLENYAVSYELGALTVEPAPLTIVLNDQTKTYGDAFSFDGTEFVPDGLLLADSVTSVGIASDGALATAVVAGSPYVIREDEAVAPTGTGIENYTVSYDVGNLTVLPAQLTVTADNQTKTFGELFAFDGTEFTATGLLFSDVLTSLTLSSDGAAEDAVVADSPYAINISDPVGSGLGNYTIVLGPDSGTLTVNDRPVLTQPPPFDGPAPSAGDDNVTTLFGDGGTTAEQARDTLGVVQSVASRLEIAADACSQNVTDANRYLACLSDALDGFANELDAISTDLPPGLENVARIVRTARVQTDRARARATARLSGATSEAQRDAIRRDALNEARAAVSTAAVEIRKAISFVRAEDPELASLQRATVTTVSTAVDNVGIKLSRAVGL